MQDQQQLQIHVYMFSATDSVILGLVHDPVFVYMLPNCENKQKTAVTCFFSSTKFEIIPPFRGFL